MKKVLHTIKSIFVILVVVLAVTMMLFTIFSVTTLGRNDRSLFGYKLYIVNTNSMAATDFDAGDLILVKNVDASTLQEGDIITFVLNEKLVVATHRVVRIDTQKQCFYTKGDANGTEDTEPVHFNNLIGIPRFSVPLLGYVSNFVQNPPGTYITVGLGALLIAAVFLPDFLPKKKLKAQEEDQEQ